MPTGFTADVANGKTTSLREFALTCARGMGALILMRDEPDDATIPPRFEPDTQWHDERIATARDMLDDLTHDQAVDRWAAANTEIHKAREEAIQRNEETRQRYNAMLAKLDKWPTDGAPEGLHGFMYRQLVDSRDFDVDDDPTAYMPEPYATVEDWKASVRTRANEELAYHTVERDKVIARTVERNAWLEKLWASLEGAE